MAINDQSRSRKTYSFFRATPVATNPLSTTISGSTGILVSGDRTAIQISLDGTAFATGSNSWASFSSSLSNSDNTADIGNGAVSAYWRKSGPTTAEVRWLISIGTTTNFGTAGPPTMTFLPKPSDVTLDSSKMNIAVGGTYDGLGVISCITGASSGTIDTFAGAAFQSSSFLLTAWPSIHSAQMTAANGEWISFGYQFPIAQ